jgi:hypothetical protein
MKRLIISITVALALLAPVPLVQAYPAQSAADTVLICGVSPNPKYEVKPRSCLLGWNAGTAAGTITLKHIHWSTWGSSTARGTALSRVRYYEPWSRARVRVSRLRCEWGHDAPCGYTRVRVSVYAGYDAGYVYRFRAPAPQPMD